MNRLEVAFEPDYSEISNGKLYLKVNLTIDGAIPLQSHDDDFDICELIESIKKDGTYFIWTCACGVPGCAGYFDGIQVSSSGDYTTWTDKDLDKVYQFETVELKNKIQSLHNDLLKWNLHANSTKTELNIWPFRNMDHLLSALK